MIAELPLQAAVDLRDVYKYAVFAENGKVFAGVPGETMKTVFHNRAAAGRLIFHRNRENKVDGLMLWYKFKRGGPMEEDDEKGDAIFIRAVFAETPIALRWGIRTFILKEPDALWCRIRLARKKGSRTLADIPQRTLARLLKT